MGRRSGQRSIKALVKMAAALLPEGERANFTKIIAWLRSAMGPVCLQIVLKSDALDGEWPSRLRTRPDISWINFLAPPGEVPLAKRS